MKVIELLGPSGVGKTFLYKKLFETYTERSYMNVSEACISAAESMKLGFEFTRYYAYSLMLKSSLFRSKAYGLSRHLLFKRERSWYMPSRYSLSFNLLKAHLLDEKNRDVFNQRVTNFRRCSQVDYVLERYLDKGQVVLFDEGMLHHHHGLNSSTISQYTAAQISRDKMLNPSAVISCELPFDQLMSRILNRREQGIDTFSHRHLSPDELKVYVHRTVAAYHQKIEALRALGIPVLVIQTDTSVSANLNTVHSFINNLISS